MFNMYPLIRKTTLAVETLCKLVETGRYYNIEINDRLLYFVTKNTLNLNTIFYFCIQGILTLVNFHIVDSIQIGIL